MNPRDVLLFAEALAECGASEALGFIERLHASAPGEAATLAALFCHRQGRSGDALPALLAAFSAYRNDAWPLPRIQQRAFELAAEIARAHPPAATPLFVALDRGPLPGFLMESARRQTLVRLTVRQWETGQPVSASAFALLEPWPTWTRDDLQNRYAFYKATGLGDAERAREDLEQFLAADAGAFGRGLEKPASAAAAR